MNDEPDEDQPEDTPGQEIIPPEPSNVIPMDDGKYPNRFKKGDPDNVGRRVGATNKNTRILKDAIMLAAELEGSDGEGTGKLVGYLRKVARDDMRAFVSLLGRVIPLQVEPRTQEDDKKNDKVVYKSVEEVSRELESRGINIDVMIRMSKLLKPTGG